MNKINQKLRKAAAIVLLLTMLLVLPGHSRAQSSVSKEENIYVSLESDGSFKNAYVVNAFALDTAGIIEDYGAYDTVYNLSTTDKLSVSKGQIRVNAPAGRFYYQGNLNTMEMPWLVSISYFLDGKKVSAQELSGAEGSLKIKISIKKNPDAEREFAEHYAVQTSLTLDAGSCTVIKAAGATIANAGGSKVISFTMLQGSEADYNISAEIKDFYMDGVQITGVPLSISISELDTGIFTNKLSRLSDGIAEIDDGIQELNGGTVDLKDGAGKLKSGMKSMQSGMTQLTGSLQTLAAQNTKLLSGSAEIKAGLSSILSGLDQFNSGTSGLSELAKGSTSIKAGIDGLSSGIDQLKNSFHQYKAQLAQNGLDAERVLQSNLQMISQLGGQIPALKVQLAGENPGSERYFAIQTQIMTYEQIAKLLQGNSGIITADKEFRGQLQTGVGNMANGSTGLKDNYTRFDAGIQAIPSMLNGLPQTIAQLKGALTTLATGYDKLHYGIEAYTGGAAEIGKGCHTLNEGYSGLVKGSESLYSGIIELYQGTQQLAKGTEQLRQGTSSMDGEIENAIDEMLSSYTGGDFEVVSFISPRNTNVESVQFVMQTGGIEEKRIEPIIEKVKVKRTFWERLLDLFGLSAAV